MLSQVHVALDIFYQHIVTVYWGVVYNHHLCLCDIHLKARRGSGFDEIFCIFANMSCLCIHLVTLFNLPCKKKIVM